MLFYKTSLVFIVWIAQEAQVQADQAVNPHIPQFNLLNPMMERLELGEVRGKPNQVGRIDLGSTRSVKRAGGKPVGERAVIKGDQKVTAVIKEASDAAVKGAAKFDALAKSAEKLFKSPVVNGVVAERVDLGAMGEQVAELRAKQKELLPKVQEGLQQLSEGIEQLKKTQVLHHLGEAG